MGQQMGEKVPPDNVRAGDAQLLRGQKIGGLTELENFAPDKTGQRGPVAERHSGHHPQKAPAKGQGDKHDQQDMGYAHHQVDTPGEDGVQRPV